ncbi:hypothetical protein [Azotosporobacter soli]|uniref:hypothetical protein n=1 Tax=Azotosporobacter soli TaxID=3055040 RepID=UPI0031FEA105
MAMLFYSEVRGRRFVAKDNLDEEKDGLVKLRKKQRNGVDNNGENRYNQFCR